MTLAWIGLAASGAEPASSVTPCTHGTIGCAWQKWDETGYRGDTWGENPILSEIDYNEIYAATSGVVEIGIPGLSGHSALFTGSSEITSSGYMFTFGLPAALNADLVDPSHDSSGRFGPDVLAMQFNVDYSDFGDRPVRDLVPYGDLTLCNMSDVTYPFSTVHHDLSTLNGKKVRQLLAILNTTLGGGTTPYPIADLDFSRIGRQHRLRGRVC